MSKRKNTKSTKKAKKRVVVESTFWQNRKLHLILIGAFAALLYVNTLGHEFTQDDAIAISENIHTLKGTDGIGDLVTKDAFHGFFKEQKTFLEGGRYRPFTFVQFAIGMEMVGKDLEKMKVLGHVMNVLWYVLTCLLLYVVLSMLLSIYKFPKYGAFLAFVAAIVFTAHPIHTEAVANIKGRDEIMAMFFSLGTLYFILKYLNKNRSVVYLGFTALSFFLAILSKENALTFIGAVPLALWVFTKAKSDDYVMSLLPMLLVFAVYLFIRHEYVGFGLSEPSKELMNNPFIKIEDNTYVDFTNGERFGTIFFSLGLYFKLLFLPHPLTHDYYPRAIEVMDFGDIAVLFSFLLYGAMLVYGLWSALKKKVIGFILLYYLGTLLIVSNLAIFVGTNLSERFLFMPSLAFGLLVALGIHHFYFKNKKQIATKTVMWLLFGLVGLYSLKTVSRNMTWQDNYTLFTTDVEVSDRSAKLQNACAGAKSDAAFALDEGADRNLLLQEARDHAIAALQIHPNYKNAHLILGNCYFGLKNYDAAMQSYDNCLKLDPGFVDAINNIERLKQAQGQGQFDQMKKMGTDAAKAGDFKSALPIFLELVKQQPNNPEINYYIGLTYQNLNEAAKARTFYQKSYDNTPDGTQKEQLQTILDAME